MNVPPSNIGLGCVTFGREISKKSSLEILNYAYDKGIIHFDTAPSYGDGSSEIILGEWLRQNQSLRNNIEIHTKVSAPFNAESIKLSIDQSLKRLNVETIDVLYFHQWHAALENPEILRLLTYTKKSGKIRSLGASNFSCVQLQKIFEIQIQNGLVPIRYIQNNNNYAFRGITNDIIQFCISNNIKIITYSPLGAGFLTGKHQMKIQEQTRFDYVPAHADIYCKDVSLNRLNELLTMSQLKQISPVELALSWALHRQHVATVLIGARSILHIDQALSSLKYKHF